MGQAFITRRGGGNGRFAVGKTTANSVNPQIVVSGIGFMPKQIMLFSDNDGLADNISMLVWNSTEQIVEMGGDHVGSNGEDYNDRATVIPNSDGFEINQGTGTSDFNHDYYWVAFEKEQGV